MFHVLFSQFAKFTAPLFGLWFMEGGLPNIWSLETWGLGKPKKKGVAGFAKCKKRRNRGKRILIAPCPRGGVLGRTFLAHFDPLFTQNELRMAELHLFVLGFQALSPVFLL